MVHCLLSVAIVLTVFIFVVTDSFYYNQLKSEGLEEDSVEQVEKVSNQQKNLKKDDDASNDIEEDLVKTFEKLDPTSTKVCVVFDSDSEENDTEINELEIKVDLKNIECDKPNVKAQNVAKKRIAKSNSKVVSFTMSGLIESQLKEKMSKKHNLLFEDDIIDELEDMEKPCDEMCSDRWVVEYGGDSGDNRLRKLRYFRKRTADGQECVIGMIFLLITSFNTFSKNSRTTYLKQQCNGLTYFQQNIFITHDLKK